jgi:hypothetical protein
MKKLFLPLAILATALGTLVASAQLPSPTFSGLTVTPGLTALAPSTAAHSGLNLAPGVAPTAPNNGDLWLTASGLFAQVGGVTVGPFNSGSGPCSTCATTTNGGPLTATAPLTVSAGGNFALGTQPFTAGINFDSQTTVHTDSYSIFEPWIWTNNGTISSVTYRTGGSGTPSFTFSLQINGTNVTGCTALVASSTSDTTATCTAANTIVTGQKLVIVITAVAGTPFSAWLQISGLRPAS